MSLAPSLLRRSVAAAAIGALALSGAVAIAPAASAAPETVSAAEAKWGVKKTWREYVGVPGQVTLAEGAQFDAASPEATTEKKAYRWPGAAGGTYDPTTGIGTIPLAGSVTYQKAQVFLDQLTFKNLTVVLDGDGTGTLLADVEFHYGEDASVVGIEVFDYDETQVPIADLSGVPDPTVTDVPSGTRVTLTAISTTLTSIGADAFGGFYDVGSSLDPLTLSFNTSAVRTATTTTVAVAPSKVAYGKARTATVNVKPVAGGSVATGSVRLKDNGSVVRTVALSNGRAVIALPTTQKVGAHTITAEYLGSPQYVPSSASTSTSVVKATSVAKGKLVKKKVKVGKKAKVKVTVSAGGVAPSGKVTIRKGKKKLKVGTVGANGKTTITLPKQKKKGTVKLKVVYAGNANVAGDTSPVIKLKVKR
jgi:hypothetical protein